MATPTHHAEQQMGTKETPAGPAGTGRGGSQTALRAHPTGTFGESFRLLALDVVRLLEGETNRSLLVMSGLPGEGRTLTAYNLARSLAELSLPVLLVDANPAGAPRTVDLGDPPGVHRIDLSEEAGGLGDFLQAARKVIARGGEEGAITIVDVPAATRSSIGFHLAKEVAGSLFVVRTRKSRGVGIPTEMRAQLDLLGARILGVVVNDG